MNLFVLFLITLVSSFCSLSYQLLIAHYLTEQTDTYILSQTLTFGFFTLFCGFGVLFFNPKKQNIFKVYLKIESQLVLMSVLIPLSLVVLHIALNYYFFEKITQILYLENYQNHVEKVLLFVIAQAINFRLGYLSGQEIASILKIKEDLYNSKIKFLGLIFCFGYIGGLISSLIIPSVFIPFSGNLLSFLFIGAINVIFILSFFFIFYFKQWISKKFAYVGLLGVSFLTLIICCNPIMKLETYNLKLTYSDIRVQNFNYQSFRTAHKLLSMVGPINRFRSVYQTIDILDFNFNKQYNFFYDPIQFKLLSEKEKHSFYFFINYGLQFNSVYHKVYHESMAHAPINVTGNKPKNVLIIGGGDGLLAKELLRYGETINITLIEIDKKIIDLAKNHPLMTSLNENSLNSAQVKVIVKDGLQFIKYTKNTYDAIYIDIPFPSNFNFIRLYSKELFTLVYQKLNSEGFMIIDTFDLNEKNFKAVKALLSTLYYSGFKNILGVGQLSNFIIGTKKNKTLEFNYDDVSMFEIKSLTNLIKIPHLDKIPIDKKSIHSLYKPNWSIVP